MPATVEFSRQQRRAPDTNMVRVDVEEVRNRVAEVLNRIGAQLIGRVSEQKPEFSEAERDALTRELQDSVATFGQIAAGLAIVDAECLPAEGAGYASTVTVRDVDTNEIEQYMLMVGSLVDIDTQQVSLASPIGQALLGKCAGDEIIVNAPHRRSRLLVTNVVTLMDKLEDLR